MSLKDLCRERVQSRTIDVTTYTCGEKAVIIVEGVLKDQRLVDYYTVAGEHHRPDTIHHMTVRMKVEIPSLIIREVEAELSAFPHPECPDTQNTLEKIKDMRIAPGFTSEAKRRIGGKRGCAHMAALILAMAPAAVQGFWVSLARKPVATHMPSKVIDRYLIDTCKVWEKGGRLAEKALRRQASRD